MQKLITMSKNEIMFFIKGFIYSIFFAFVDIAICCIGILISALYNKYLWSGHNNNSTKYILSFCLWFCCVAFTVF